MNKLGISHNQDTYLALQKVYSEKHRFYHNATHIDSVLCHFDNCQTLLTYPLEVEVALWFHDAIYKPLSTENELESANWAVQFLQQNGCNQTLIDRVYLLIMATLHTNNVKTNDQQLMVDIDLTILGSPAFVYQQFEKNVRQEYKWVPWFLYRKKRKEILNEFLNRERIYFSDFFFNKLEKQARLNLQNAISSM